LKTTSVAMCGKTTGAMPKLRVGSLLLLLPLLAAVIVPQAHGERHKIKRLNPPGAAYTSAFGLNNNGEVVGFFTDASGTANGFSYRDGQYTTITFPGSMGLTEANGVNDSNTVVGIFVGADGMFHSYLLTSDGQFSRYDVNPGVSTSIYAINNAGNFAGFVEKQGKVVRGFVNLGGMAKEFTFKGNYTFAYGIDSANDIVGSFIDSNFLSHGFYRAANGKMTQIDYPGASTTVCLGINDLGVISGYYVDADNVAHGFTLTNGAFHTSRWPVVAGMNNEGAFVGYYIGRNQVNYGFVATPVSGAPTR
jgi:probable HAF family extracellular repeat protein